MRQLEKRRGNAAGRVPRKNPAGQWTICLTSSVTMSDIQNVTSDMSDVSGGFWVTLHLTWLSINSLSALALREVGNWRVGISNI